MDLEVVVDLEVAVDWAAAAGNSQASCTVREAATAAAGGLEAADLEVGVEAGSVAVVGIEVAAVLAAKGIRTRHSIPSHSQRQAGKIPRFAYSQAPCYRPLVPDLKVLRAKDQSKRLPDRNADVMHNV
jgi:hypothetical protein